MQKFWNKLLNLGASSELNHIELNQVKIVNFGALFVTIAGIAFFIESLQIGNSLLSFALIISPIFYTLVFVSNYYKKRKLARNLLFFGLCIEISAYSLLDNPSSFTLNYFFGIAMISFVLYNKTINRVLGLVLCVILYFGLDYLQPHIQSQLPFDPIIYVLDVLTMFTGILVIIHYFLKINTEYQQIILEQKIELEKINVNKTKLISIITHDIRNPINSLNLVLELQKDRELNNQELNDLLNKIRKEFINQFESIDNLLKWSQNQLSEINVNYELVDVDQLIVNTIKELNYNINQKEINLGISICGSDKTKCDKTHLGIIFKNILFNAIKFTKNKGHIYITTTNEFNKYRIDIEDDGIGFEDYQTNEFEEYKGTSQQIGTNDEIGNGLGLIISKELAEKNNAKILIKNNSGGGSTIRIEFNIS